jgi:hypothetical protein
MKISRRALIRNSVLAAGAAALAGIEQIKKDFTYLKQQLQ